MSEHHDSPDLLIGAAGLLGAALVALGILGVIDLRDPAMTELEPAPAVYAIPPPATTTTPPPIRPATVTETAERGQQPFQATPIPTAPAPVGLWGMPFAPDGLERCEELSWYRSQAGLIDHFDGVGFRESSCRNDVSTFCCHGYFQIYVSLGLRDHFLAPRFDECEIDEISDVLTDDDDTPEEDGYKKQRNACAAVAIYDYQGGGAWDAW